MSLEEELARRTSADVVRLVAGQVVTRSGALTVNVAGGGGTVRWCDGYTPTEGDAVLVALSGLEAWVLMRVGGAVRPETGVVQSIPGGATITVTIAGTNTACRFLASYAPVVGDIVVLSWQASRPVVLGKVGTTAAPAPPAPPAPPPGQATVGTTTFPATDSASFRDGAWRTDTSDVIQGDAPGYTGHPNSGAWFYAGFSQLVGATVTAAEIWLPGDSSAASSPAVHLYRHSSGARPAGDVARVAGPFDVTKGGEASGWYPLDLTLAQGLVTSGGGVGITGAPYARHKGLTKDGQSGAVRISWSR